MRRLPPAWFLFFFAPLTAEYISGSSSFLNPIFVLANLLLYGAGTLLIRELRVRWGKGWPAVFILAAAYVVAEEGLMLNTLFDPTQNATGRALGVNWVWTAGMWIVHSLVSIFTPVLLAEAIYDQQKDESWIKPRTCWWLLAAFAANVFGLGRLIAPTNRPGLEMYLIEAAFIGGCLWLAKHAPSVARPEAAAIALRLPRQLNSGRNDCPIAEPPSEAISERASKSLFARSLAGTTITMVVGFATPTLPIPAAAKVLVMLSVYLAFLEMLRRDGTFRPSLNPRSKLAVAAGIISFWILISPFKSLALRNIGPAFFGALMAVFLFRMRRRLRNGLPIIWARGTR